MIDARRENKELQEQNAARVEVAVLELEREAGREETEGENEADNVNRVANEGIYEEPKF